MPSTRYNLRSNNRHVVLPATTTNRRAALADAEEVEQANTSAGRSPRSQSQMETEEGEEAGGDAAVHDAAPAQAMEQDGMEIDIPAPIEVDPPAPVESAPIPPPEPPMWYDPNCPIESALVRLLTAELDPAAEQPPVIHHARQAQLLTPAPMAAAAPISLGHCGRSGVSVHDDDSLLSSPVADSFQGASDEYMADSNETHDFGRAQHAALLTNVMAQLGGALDFSIDCGDLDFDLYDELVLGGIDLF